MYGNTQHIAFDSYSRVNICGKYFRLMFYDGESHSLVLIIFPRRGGRPLWHRKLVKCTICICTSSVKCLHTESGISFLFFS